MTKLDFPDTPSTGQQYGSSGTVWRWDGTRWGSTAGAAGARGRVAYAQITAAQSGITAAGADLAGLSVTWTADPSRTYRTTLYGEASSTVANDVPMVNIRNAAGSDMARSASVCAVANTAERQIVELIETGLSGSITRKAWMRLAVGSGTFMWYAAPSSPSFILVEDITYEAGSSGATPTEYDKLPKGVVGHYSFFDVYTDNIGPTWVPVNYMQVLANVKAGRRYRVSAVATFQIHTFGGTGNLALRRGTENFAVIWRWGNGPATADITRSQRVEHIYTATTTGQERWDGWAAFDAGNCSHRPSAGMPAWITVEDLGSV